jgi:putative nucleotidyltransferase with HDIG domain
MAKEMLRRFTAAVRSGQLYAGSHPIVAQNVRTLVQSLDHYLRNESTVVIGIIEDEVIVGDMPVARGDGLQGLIRRLKQAGIERIAIDRGVTTEELTTFIATLSGLDAQAAGEHAFAGLSHVRVGRVTVGPTHDGPTESADIATFRRMYDDAVGGANQLWQGAQAERQVDATVARTLVNGLAQAVSQNRTALLALTTLKNYVNYTFTHMVNVSILTMGQARGLGIDGPLLREFGLAALMHDIGKVRTPLEILNKPEKLTDDEFTIMKRHAVDGAAILRATPDMPALAPIVAFEHHRRLDNSGYPDINRATLNVATMLCSLADVYDAMRSQRAYQNAFPSDRILAVMRRSEGKQFDQHLVRRFVQLIGIYPVGALVKVDTGELAVVRQIHAPDPHRPQVRIISDPSGAMLERTYDVNLWDTAPGTGRPSAVAAPVDPEPLGIDPMTLM